VSDSTELARVVTEVAVPGTGEIVDMNDPRAVARALNTLRDFQRTVREVSDVLQDRLREERAVLGARALEYQGVSVKFGADTEITYDAAALEEGLRAAGMPESRIAEIVVETVERKVRAVEAKKAAAVNPAYAAVVEQARSVVPKRQTVTVEVAR
jgi:Glu-tRNA(Gln) amidotransferase subunit E-like FAD-binding protein